MRRPSGYRKECLELTDQSTLDLDVMYKPKKIIDVSIEVLMNGVYLLVKFLMNGAYLLVKVPVKGFDSLVKVL